ncbi:MAG: hypothetical protein R3F29_04705 [Planctomycetota bacterium]
MAPTRIGLSWPCRTAKNGVKHSIVRPVDDDARRAIEKQILGDLSEHVASETGLEVEDA